MTSYSDVQEKRYLWRYEFNITVLEKELSRCTCLLYVQSATKKLKKQDFYINETLIQETKETIEKYKQVLNEYVTKPISGINYSEILRQKGETIRSSIINLMKETNFFKIIYDDTIFSDLEKATANFIKYAV